MKLVGYKGKAIQWDVLLSRDGVPLVLPDGTKFWLTAKADAALDDSAALFQLTEASEITINVPAGQGIRIRASAEQMARGDVDILYFVDLQYQIPGEDPDIPDDGSGTLQFSQPVTSSNS